MYKLVLLDAFEDKIFLKILPHQTALKKMPDIPAEFRRLIMSLFIARQLKHARKATKMTQEDVAKKMSISRATLYEIETDERQVSAEEIVEFARLYKVDVRELLMEEYQDQAEEQRLANRFMSFLKLLDKLSDRQIEDVYWILKRKVDGQI